MSTDGPISDLRELLRRLDPMLHEREYVFCQASPELDATNLKAVGWFREPEGLTVILEQSAAAESGLTCSEAFRMITLRVQSSLDAVGLTAVVATALAEKGIAANVVAAFHHDHVFVPSDRAEDALAVLGALQEREKGAAR